MPDRLEKAERRVAKEDEEVHYVDITDAKGIIRRATIGQDGRCIGDLKVIPTPQPSDDELRDAICQHASMRVRMRDVPTMYDALILLRDRDLDAPPIIWHGLDRLELYEELITQATPEVSSSGT